MIQHIHYWPRIYIQVGCTAFAIAALAMPVGILLLRRFGVVDGVVPEKIHRAPVVRGGGVIIFIAFAVAVLIPNYRSDAMNGVLIGAFLCLVVGALDDFFGGIPAMWKFLTLVLVTGVLYRFGVRVNLFPWDALDVAFTLLWIVGVTSAFNGIDNMDGLAGGTAVIASAMFLTIAVQSVLIAGGETSVSWFGMLASGLLGACLGFLIFNFKPARVFMGDSGSFFIGFLVAALGVMGEWSENRIVSCTVPILILGIPVFDFAFVIISRILNGQTRTVREVIEHCSTDHLSHRLVWIGFSERKAVFLIYLMAFAMGVSGILLHNSESLLDGMLALGQGLSIVAVIAILMATAKRHVEKRRQLPDNVEELPRKIDMASGQ